MTNGSVDQQRARIVTLPNALSAYRIAIAPVIAYMIMSNHRKAFAVAKKIPDALFLQTLRTPDQMKLAGVLFNV